MLQFVTVTIRAVFIIPLGLAHLLLEGITALIMWDKSFLHGTSFDRIMGILTHTQESTDAYHWCLRRDGKKNKFSKAERTCRDNNYIID